MERRPIREGQESKGESNGSHAHTSSTDHDFSSILDQIRVIAHSNARASLDTEKQLMLFLKSWWSRTYNRPLKDPILETYTLEELMYEFWDRIERAEASKERVEEETDKIELDKEQSDLDWAEQEEKKELETLKSKAAHQEVERTDPTKDPANVKWMEEQLAAAKIIHGDDFGEDIDDNFEGD